MTLANLVGGDKSDEIKRLARNKDRLGIQELFEDYIEAYNAKCEQKQKEQMARMSEYNEYVEHYRMKHDKFDTTKPFVASNGCTVTDDGKVVVAKDGAVLTKRHGKGLRDSARSEYAACKNKWREGLLSYQDYFETKQNE